MKNREEYIAILEVENAEFKKKQRDLIKYLEDKIYELSKIICENELNRYSSNYEEIQKETYQDILERLKSGKYE